MQAVYNNCAESEMLNYTNALVTVDVRNYILSCLGEMKDLTYYTLENWIVFFASSSFLLS